MPASPPRPDVPRDRLFPGLVKLWVWFSALASLAGWSLSVIGQLNRTGYLIFFAVAAAIFFYYRRPRLPQLDWGKFSRRFRRPLPGAFVVLALLILAGSIIYAPTNYTGLNYHLGRVLQWLAHGQWWWIHTPIYRMNYSGCDFEWLTTPVVLFTQSDRALFLVNFIPFLLLPGLIYSLFWRLGVARRAAWHWMWLLPTSYVFLLQAGSIGNDALAAVYTLAAIDFACRAWESRSVSDLWHSALAAALITGTKAVNLPILLPWVILVLPLLSVARRRWLATVPVMALAGIASFLPIAGMNQIHSGDWLGRTVEITNKEIHQPLVGILGNLAQVLQNNLVPPIFPLAGWWNTHAESLLPPSLAAAFKANFEQGFYVVGEVPTEDFSGLGFGIFLLLGLSLAGALWLRDNRTQPQIPNSVPRWLSRCVLAAAWISVIAYGMKSGMTTAAREITSFYFLLIPSVLILRGQAQVTRCWWWRLSAGVVVVLALIVLVVSPDRPLWPAKTILSRLHAKHPEQISVSRALQVYSIFSKRNDALAGVRNLLPPDLHAVGFIGDADDCDVSLWRPFGSRGVEHFFLTDPPAQIRQRVEYVVLGTYNLQMHGVTLDDWLKSSGSELVATTNIAIKLTSGPLPWYITRFKSQ